MLHELVASFLALYLRNHSRETRPKKDFQVENGLVTGIEGQAMAEKSQTMLLRE